VPVQSFNHFFFQDLLLPSLIAYLPATLGFLFFFLLARPKNLNDWDDDDPVD
jgi:hypothetical protein